MTAPSEERSRQEAPYVPGESGPAAEFEAQLQRVAASDITLLLEGESGSGKSRAARRLHDASRRAGRPFMEINVSALAPSLVEAELFGHEEGAFTGAHKARPGRFVQAHGGTLVLEGVENLAEELQVKLLRVLQEREVEPLGGTPRDVDVRVVATTSESLLGRVEAGAFREDLYYRLAVVTLEAPPLRARFDQLAQLVEALTQGVAQRARVPARPFGAAALERLARHAWPGNLRELENVVERVLVLGGATDAAVAPDELEFLRGVERSQADYIASLALGAGLSVDELGRALIEAAVREERGNLSAAARRIGLSRRALDYRLRRRVPDAPGTGGEPA
jgi:DNA-binding NtrC family response regulator